MNAPNTNILSRTAFALMTILMTAVTCNLTSNLANADALNEGGSIIGVELSDLIEFMPDSSVEAQIIKADVASHQDQYFAAPLNLSPPEKAIQLESRLIGLKWFQKPEHDESITTVFLEALISKADGTLVFRDYIAKIDIIEKAVKAVSLLKETKLSDTEWTFEVSLLERKLILYSQTLDVVYVYPLDVGAFDEGVIDTPGLTRLLTPRLKNAHIRQSRISLDAKDAPEYYRGLPILNIQKNLEENATISIHTTVTTYFHRGFVSRGGIRLKDRDLIELALILKGQKLPNTFFSIHTQSQMSRLDHPMPLHNASYFTARNAGTMEKPIVARNATNRIILDEVTGFPPVDKLPTLEPGDEEVAQAMMLHRPNPSVVVEAPVVDPTAFVEIDKDNAEEGKQK